MGGVARFRDAEEADFESMVALNAAVERSIGPMDLARLKLLHGLASHYKVAVADSRVVGFMLAMREHARYENENYAWFAARYPKFIYVDRIVIAGEYAGRKIGSTLYRDLIAYARTSGVPVIACEYNIDPPNLPSKALHDKFGFREVGVRRPVSPVAKLVSMQIATV